MKASIEKARDGENSAMTVPAWSDNSSAERAMNREYFGLDGG
jgi:hypothetical protein